MNIKPHKVKLFVSFIFMWFFVQHIVAQNQKFEWFEDSAKYYTSIKENSKELEFYSRIIKQIEPSNYNFDNKNRILASSYRKKGELLKRNAKYSEALSYYFKSNKIYETLADSSGIGITYIGIAGVYKHEKKIKDALANFRLSLNFFQPEHDAGQIASAFNNIGLIHDFEFGDFDSALFYYNKALSTYELIKNKSGVSIEHSNISGVYTQLKKYDEALKHREVCLKIDKELDDKEGELYSMWGLGEIYQYKKNYAEAEKYFLNALQIAEELNLLYEKSEGHRVIAELYEASGDYKKAYFHLNKFVKLNEEIMNEESVKKTAELQTQFDTEKKEQRIRLLEKDKQLDEEKHNRTKQFLLYTAIIAILIVILLIYTVKTNQDRKKVNLLLEKQKNEIELKNIELEQLSIVASETTNAVTIADAKGKILWINKGFEKLYQLNLQQFKAAFGESIFSASSNPNLEDLVKEAAKNKISINYTCKIEASNQTSTWIQTTLTPIMQDDELSKLVLIDTNITALKQAELEISDQRDQLSIKNKNILQSIDYAKRIQDAILPDLSIFKKHFSDAGVFYQPKDIVSGDLYWINENENEIVFSVIDCTGHGVPGAFMTIFAYNLLDSIIIQHKERNPDKMISLLNTLLIESLDKNKQHVDDGMELVICNYNKISKTLKFSGCFSSLYFIRNKELVEYKSDLNIIGKSTQFDNPITLHEIQIEPNDLIYLLTDGFADQKGEISGKKFFYKPLREMLLNNNNLPLIDSTKILSDTFNHWKGNREQIDDICILGIRF